MQCLSKEHFFSTINNVSKYFKHVKLLSRVYYTFWGLFAIAIIPLDVINYYHYYYYLTRCEQKASVQNLKMLSQGQQDVAHLKHFKQIDSFQSVDLKKEQNKTIKKKQTKRGKSLRSAFYFTFLPCKKKG